MSTTIASLTRRLSLTAFLLALSATKSLGAISQPEITGLNQEDIPRITLRVKVEDQDGRPVLDLKPDDFKLLVDETPLKFNPRDWRKPEESTPPPAYIVVLLDMSGSMLAKDSQGDTKFAGAIEALRTLVKDLSTKMPNTQMSIVPFGEGNAKCTGFPATEQEINNFMAVNDFKLTNQIDYLGSLEPCAATNLYDPLRSAYSVLNNPQDPRFYPENASEENKPRLAIILLSDGYHNRANEQKDYKRLITLFEKRNPEDPLPVYTLGYGLTPQQLSAKCGIKRTVTRADFGGICQKRIREEEFIDYDRLKGIAAATGGFADFSPDADSVSEKLQLFLVSLLGAYEISYDQPNARRGSKHTVQVSVLKEKSKPYPFIIRAFGQRVDFLPIRLILVISTVVILLLLIIPFWIWARQIRSYEA